MTAPPSGARHDNPKVIVPETVSGGMAGFGLLDAVRRGLQDARARMATGATGFSAAQKGGTFEQPVGLVVADSEPAPRYRFIGSDGALGPALPVESVAKFAEPKGIRVAAVGVDKTPVPNERTPKFAVGPTPSTPTAEEWSRRRMSTSALSYK